MQKGPHKGKPISIRGIQKRIEYYSKKTGLGISCHRLRHTMATQLLNADAMMVTVQELLGHNCVTSTQRYCKVSNTKVKRDYFKAMNAVMKRTALFLAAVVFIAGHCAAEDIVKPIGGGTLKGARGMQVEGTLRNDHAKFAVRVAVNRPDRIYEKGELMMVKVQSTKSGYLYLLYRQADGSTKCLFPNVHEKDNRITGGKPVIIPTRS